MKGICTILISLMIFSMMDNGASKTFYRKNMLRGLDIRDEGECVEKWEPCDGHPSCCGTLHCFWVNGYSPFNDGECVECIDRTQVCQYDEQCCEPLVCQKPGSFEINGVCDILYAKGDECNRDDNCESGKCDEPLFGIGLGVCE